MMLKIIRGKYLDITKTTLRDQMLATQVARKVVNDEVEDYLTSVPSVDAVPLEFWRRAGSKYPILQKIAKDYLAIPATSVQSERENSRARYVVTDQRNRLSNTCVQATLCLKSWMSFTEQGEFFTE